MIKKVDSVIDGHKIYLHPDKVNQWNLTGDCYPIHIEIGATSKCNHDCIFCALDFTRGKTDIDKEIMLTNLKDMANHKVKSVMFGGEGEPTLHPYLSLFIKKAKEFGLDVALTTNGTLFDKNLQENCLPYLSWIKFSIDAGTSKNYSLIHKVKENKFEKLIENISNSIKLKNKKNLDVTIGTQFLTIPQNINKQELSNLIDKLNIINPDYLSIKPYSDHPQSKKNLIVNPSEYQRLEKDLLNFKPNFNIFFRKETINRIQEGNNYPECYGLSFISLIDSKGNILPCNVFYDQEEFIYGNLYKNNFSEIWEGEKRKEILGKIKKKGMQNCRNGCRCDAGNRYLFRIKNPQLHDNFT